MVATTAAGPVRDLLVDEEAGPGLRAGDRTGRSLWALGLVDWLRLRSCLSRIEPFPLRRRNLSAFRQ